jgi:hypothetical protein
MKVFLLVMYCSAMFVVAAIAAAYALWLAEQRAWGTNHRAVHALYRQARAERRVR